MLVLVLGPSHLPGIGIDASESSLMNSMMGNGLYIDQSSSQRALSPEDVEPLADPSVNHADAVSLQQHFAQQQLHSLESFHVQQPCLSTQVPLSSDTAQNTCIAVGETERRSGDESVNDYAAKPEETMDDIMRFFLKVLPSFCNSCMVVWQLSVHDFLSYHSGRHNSSMHAVCEKFTNFCKPAAGWLGILLFLSHPTSYRAKCL